MEVKPGVYWGLQVPGAVGQVLQRVSLHYTDPQRSTWPHRSKLYRTCRSSCILWWPYFQPLQQKRHKNLQTASKGATDLQYVVNKVVVDAKQRSFLESKWCLKKLTIFPFKRKCVFYLPMVVEQRSNWDGQSQTRLQVPGFAPQQVKHFSPEAAKSGEHWRRPRSMENTEYSCNGLYCSYLLAAAHRRGSNTRKASFWLIWPKTLQIFNIKRPPRGFIVSLQWFSWWYLHGSNVWSFIIHTFRAFCSLNIRCFLSRFNLKVRLKPPHLEKLMCNQHVCAA